MTVDKIFDGKTLTMKIIGELDTATSPGLETEIDGSIEDVDCLILDMSRLDFISSAGLRVILKSCKTLKAPRKLIIRNVNESVMEVVEITCLTDILTIE